MITAVPVFVWASIAKNTVVWMAAYVPAFPALLTIVTVFLGVFVFSFDYSLLGKLERSLPPPNFVAKYRTASYGRIGSVRFTWPLIEWSVGREGVLIKMQLLGSAFIPAKLIIRLTRGAWIYDVLEHDCPEIASPVYLPKDVCEAVSSILEIQRA